MSTRTKFVAIISIVATLSLAASMAVLMSSSAGAQTTEFRVLGTLGYRSVQVVHGSMAYDAVQSIQYGDTNGNAGWDSERSRCAVWEDYGVSRVRIYSCQEQQLFPDGPDADTNPDWQVVLRNPDDVVGTQTRAFAISYTPHAPFCANTSQFRLSRTANVHAARRSSDGALFNRTSYSNLVWARMLASDPACRPPTPSPTPAADLALAASHNPPSPLNGEPFTVVFAAGNEGNATANGAVFTVNLPDAWTGVTADVAGGTCTVDAGTNVVTCQLNDLTPGEVNMVSIHVADAHGAQAVSLTGTLSSTTAGVAPVSVTETFTIRPAADLSVVKTASDTSVAEVDDNFNYVLTLHNAGPNTATALTIRDSWPAGLDDPDLSAVSTTADVSCHFINPDATNANEVVQCDVVDMAPSETVVITIGARTNGEASGDLTNTVTVAADQVDPDTTNNSDTLTVPVT